VSEPYEPAEGLLSLRDHPLRLGRKLGRTLYLGTGGDFWHKDTCIGLVDTPELAQEIMRAVNAYYGHGER
jgi:hypothetical protein